MAADNKPPVATVQHLKQGTQEWLNAREGLTGVCVGSSLLGAVAGLSRFKRPYAAYEQLVTRKSDPENENMRHGHLFEGTCAVNFQTLAKCPPLHEAGVARATEANNRFTANQRPYYSGSIDRWGCDCGVRIEGPNDIDLHMGHSGFFVVECKCPATNSSYDAYYGSIGAIKDEHLCQLHLQMALFGLDKIFYTAALVRASDGRVMRSAGYMVHWSAEFWEYVLMRADPVIACAVDTFYGGEIISEDALTDEIVKAAGNDGKSPPHVKIDVLW